MAMLASTIHHRHQHLAALNNIGMAMLASIIRHHIQTLKGHALVREELGIARAIIVICPVQHPAPRNNIGMEQVVFHQFRPAALNNIGTAMLAYLLLLQTHQSLYHIFARVDTAGTEVTARLLKNQKNQELKIIQPPSLTRFSLFLIFNRT